MGVALCEQAGAVLNNFVDKTVRQGFPVNVLRAVAHGGFGPATVSLVEKGVATPGTLSTFVDWQLKNVDKAWKAYEEAKEKAKETDQKVQEPPSKAQVAQKLAPVALNYAKQAGGERDGEGYGRVLGQLNRLAAEG